MTVIYNAAVERLTAALKAAAPAAAARPAYCLGDRQSEAEHIAIGLKQVEDALGEFIKTVVLDAQGWVGALEPETQRCLLMEPLGSLVNARADFEDFASATYHLSDYAA